ncbi:MAG: 3-oxoacyl-[acyl-carrier-protein] reductase [Acidobacteriota bacterium]|nr:3-oxoacyl-[acyl-carrier-protein] reductase [Acidobacteriota bacterium]
MFRLDGRTALVTGASRGIGEGIARRLAEAGARVVAAARTTASLDSLVAELHDAGHEASALTLDVSRPESIAEALKTLPDDLLPVQILVNNAGITADNLLGRMDLDQWRSVLETNLTGSYALTRALMRGMLRSRWGRVINISSVVALMGNAGQVNYAASKAGLIGFSKSLAREIGSRNITVNVVAPGYVETAMTAAMTEEHKTRLVAEIVLGRLGTCDDIAAAVHFLASEDAGYVTGQVLNVSGGLYI